MSSDFYIRGVGNSCFVHPNKVARWEVWRGSLGHYRYACTKACAERQMKHLQTVHEGRLGGRR